MINEPVLFFQYDNGDGVRSQMGEGNVGPGKSVRFPVPDDQGRLARREVDDLHGGPGHAAAQGFDKSLFGRKPGGQVLKLVLFAFAISQFAIREGMVRVKSASERVVLQPETMS